MASTNAGAYSLKRADTIRKNNYIVIDGRACKVSDVTTTRARKDRLDFVAFDIFDGTRLSMSSVESSSNVHVPRVDRTYCRLHLITANGRVRLEVSKNSYRFLQVNDDNLLTQLRKEFEPSKVLYLTLLSAMGTEKICGVTEIRDSITELYPRVLPTLGRVGV